MNFRIDRCRTFRSLLLAAIASALVAGCVGPDPGLTLRYAKKNIIVRADHSIAIENDRVDWNQLIVEMKRRNMNDRTPITVHFHKSVSAEIYNAVIQKLMTNGFTNLEPEVFSHE